MYIKHKQSHLFETNSREYKQNLSTHTCTRTHTHTPTHTPLPCTSPGTSYIGQPWREGEVGGWDNAGMMAQHPLHHFHHHLRGAGGRGREGEGREKEVGGSRRGIGREGE